MKKLYQYFFISVVLLFASCSDDYSESFDGDWELVSVSGGIGGGLYSVSWDNIRISDCNFYLFDRDILLLSADIDYFTDQEFGDIIVNFDFRYENELPGTLLFDVFENKSIFINEYEELVISDGCCDLYSFGFRRF